MALHRHREVARIAAPIDEVWGFFSDPRNLSRITPPWLGFEVTSEPPARMYPGLLITYRIRPIGDIPMSWVTEITNMVEGQLFVDEQRIGPYQMWHHQHLFRSVEGGTEMQDIVHYALPFGPLGDLVNTLTVRRKVDAIFDFRRTVLAQRFAMVSAGLDTPAASGNGRRPARATNT